MTNFIRFALLLSMLVSMAACQPLTHDTQPATDLLTPTEPAAMTHAPVEYEYSEGALPEPADAPLMQDAAGFESQFAIADQFLLLLTDVPAAPAGQAYQGWLTSSDGALLSVGQLVPDADGVLTIQWTSPTGENLLARFTGFEITLEPADGSDMPGGESAYAGSMDAEQVTKARLLFVTNTVEPATPLNTPYIPGVLTQLEIAIQHIQNAQNAEAIGAYDEMRVHLEHVVNILEGADGARFQDYNGDGAAQNPGDGFGVKGYARQAAAVMGIPELALSIEKDVDALQDQALAIFEQTDLSKAAEALTALYAAGEALRDGPIAELYHQADKNAWFPVQAVP